MRYESPATIENAVDLLANSDGHAFVLAGGTDLLVRMKGDDFNASLVVDIKSVDGMGQIEETADGFVIGAAVPCAALSEHAALVAAWPGVVEAANLIGSTQVQSRCTMSGNLCNASPAADSVPAMVAANAQARIIGPDGRRTIDVADVPTAPGQTSLAKGEIIEAILLPKPGARTGDAYLRFIPRTEMDIAVVGAAVNLTLDTDGTVQTARVVLGAVAPSVVVVDAAADALLGSKLSEDTLKSVEVACVAASNPIDDKRGTVEFRNQVAGVLGRRAAAIAFERAGGQS
ncbi:FAD binding domain-containing protein [Octadecabacter ascidiaceicola]|uniref:Carbon monoxide dehydrogenase medium chain n=1 Tax=Octadecabacter ascidiaceicola TaxID=1655543 RepID=A0A238KFZ2_9RHOB|nr:xanthine dehydrogenase family protein subunit M [Octadecabacter ascidiaceicola]SMX41765.1 Carbon monoxide dehydrogenase medium chain [Octadecabacter ascidiaceicola]